MQLNTFLAFGLNNTLDGATGTTDGYIGPLQMGTFLYFEALGKVASTCFARFLITHLDFRV